MGPVSTYHPLLNSFTLIPITMAHQTNMEKVTEINDQFSDKFHGNLRNLLWQIMVESALSTKLAAFHPCIGSGETELGIAIANEPGYSPTRVFFQSHHHPTNEAITEQLNAAVFGHTRDAAEDIVFSSMFAKPAPTRPVRTDKLRP